MKSSMIASANLSLLLALCMTGCATVGTDPQTLRPAADARPIDIARPVVANYPELRDTSLRLGQGRYLPVAQDDGGVYYACPFGVVLHTVGAADWTFNRLFGGVYIPGPGAQERTKKVWFAISGGAGSTGKLKVPPEVGNRLAQQCDGLPADIVQPANGAVNFVVTPMGSNTVAMAGPAVAGGVVSSVIVNQILTSNDGRYFFPPVVLDAPIELKASTPQ